MKTLKSKLIRFEKDTKKRINLFKISIAKLIIWELIQKTPVDTSKALSNWIVGLGKSNNRKIQAHYVGTKGSTQGQSSHTAYMLGQAIIQRAKVGEIIYINNNVDYIELLNMGRSAQAERHFIQHSIEKALENADKVKL